MHFINLGPFKVLFFIAENSNLTQKNKNHFNIKTSNNYNKTIA